MDEPAVSVHIEGSHDKATGSAFPPCPVDYRNLYLRTRHKLDSRPEPLGPEQAEPEGFTQLPMTLSNDTAMLDWATDAFVEPATMLGTGEARLFVAIDQDDTNFILRLWDAAPDGNRQLITTGYLKASQNELDEQRSTQGDPRHPHTRKQPVTPDEINEYVLRLYPFANTFQPGHKLVAELSNNEPMADDHNALLPPDAFHLPIGRATTNRVYRDAAHPSRLILPCRVETS